jgi:RecJ-like exonuclease
MSNRNETKSATKAGALYRLDGILPEQKVRAIAPACDTDGVPLGWWRVFNETSQYEHLAKPDRMTRLRAPCSQCRGTGIVAMSGCARCSGTGIGSMRQRDNR